MAEATATNPQAAETPSYIDAGALRVFVQQLFVKLGVSEEDARITADVLVEGDLRGVDSHGVARLESYYVSRMQKGLIDPKAEVKVLRESPVSIALDGANGLGQVVSHRAMSAAIEKAKTSGIGMATARGSNHFGIAGYYAIMAMKEDLIGMTFTNTQPLVMPLFGRKLMTGTNPIAVAIPGDKERPWVLDMATSVVPKGKLEVAARKGLQMPDGWAVDKNGLPTNDPHAALDGGSPMPLGGTRELGGHKGYDLAIFVDIFSGVLSGANWGPHVGEGGGARDIGHFFMAFRPDLFMDLQEFKERMDRFVRELKDSPPAQGAARVIVAGEPEDEAYARYSKSGVPVHPTVLATLKTMGEDLGVALPETVASPR